MVYSISPSIINVIITPFLPVRFFLSSVAGEVHHCNDYAEFDHGSSAIIRCGTGKTAVLDCCKALSPSCHTVLFVGSCGGIATQLGEVLIAQPPAEAPTLYRCSTQVLSFCAARHISARQAIIQSIDEPLSNNLEHIQELKKKNIDAVDLESASFLEFARSAQWNAAALLYVSDLPETKPYTQPHTPDDRLLVTNGRTAACKTAADFLKEYDHEHPVV